VNHEALVDVDALYRRFVPMVRSRAQAILRNEADAQDVAQEVFVKFLKHRKREGSERHVGGMLFCMTTNLALNRIRDHKRRKHLLEQNRQVFEGGSHIGEHSIDVRAVLGHVDHQLASVAVHYYIDGMEQEEIAEVTGIPRRTVGRRLEKFRSQAMRFIKVPNGVA